LLHSYAAEHRALDLTVHPTTAVRGPLEVRSADDADLPELRAIAAESLDRERVDPAGVADLLFARPGVAPSLRLVATLDATVIGFCFASATDGVGYLDGLAVRPAVRRRGAASALIAKACARLAAQGSRLVKTGGNNWYYAWPGIDLDYTAAVRLVEHLGFHRESLAHNMDVDLAGWVPHRCQSVRRGTAADLPAVGALVHKHFDPVWEHEMRRALSRTTPTAFVAEHAGRIVGFAGYDVYRPDLFGPLGTDPADRGRGVGRALLRACLDDMAAAGLAVAQVSWVGPADFYAKAVDARIGRTFAVFTKALAAREPNHAR
jgi:ribosomal protein S18 acetylase RimI-like enzyme